MAFSPKLPEAARRHLEAADLLCEAPNHRKDVAGYLYGIAAECAIKQMVIPLPLPKDTKHAILFAHFPELRTLIRDAVSGRRAQQLLSFMDEKRQLMNNWDIRMRYADARQIRDEWIMTWQKQAKDVVGALGT